MHLPRYLLVLWLVSSAVVVLPTTAASDGCWYRETTQQELFGVGDEAAFLEIEQSTFSASCDPGDTQPAAVACAGVASGDDGELVTPPVFLPEVRVLGVTVVEGGTGVPSQAVPVPGQPDPAVDDHDECLSPQQVVVRLVVDSGQDTVVGTDGTTQVGGAPFVKAVTESLLPNCSTPEGQEANLCFQGDGITGVRVQVEELRVGFSI